MTHEVRLQPGGRQFVAQPEESILHCALRAGLALPYGCTRGTCGDCRARVLTGQHARIGHQDFSLSAAEKAAGTVLLCRTAACSDMDIEVTLASGVEDMPRQSVPVKLCETRLASEGIAELGFKVQRGKVFRFLAGQKARLTDGHHTTTPLPLYSCPCDGSVVRFLLPTELSDPILAPVIAMARQGTSRRRAGQVKLTLQGPEGTFVLDEESDAPIAFVCLDEGFGPINSLLEHALNLEMEQPISLIRFASDELSYFAHNYCRSLADAYDNVRYSHEILARSGSPASVDFDVIANAVVGRHSQAAADIYVAGSSPFVAAFSNRWPQARVHEV